MNARLHSRPDLSESRIEDMFRLLVQHFDGVTHSQFLADLDAKSHVLLLTDTAGHLVGFSTLDFQITGFRGQTESVVYSGDTIMAPDSWNSTILSRAWIEAVYDIYRRHGRGPLWWLLITSGFRTYRLLPVFWREYFPCCSADTPEPIRERLNTFARARFGPCFEPDAGIVRFSEPQRLREHLSGIPSSRVRNRHVAFFQQRNPGHTEGDELVCLTRLEENNLAPAGRRIVDTIREQPVLSTAPESRTLPG